MTDQARTAAPPCFAPPAAPGSSPGDERSALVEALRQAGGNKSQAARVLGVSRLTVLNRMRKHGVTCERTVAS